MIIDGHAHACGSYCNLESINKYLDEHGIDMVVLSAGEPDSKKDYAYPMLSEIFKGQSLGYFFNKIIHLITGIKHASDFLDEQNEMVYQYSRQMPKKVIHTYWVNPLVSNCMDKLELYFSKYHFKMMKFHQCWTAFDIDSDLCAEVFKWAEKQNIPIFIHLSSRSQVIKFVKIANELGNTKFIVAHMIGFDYISKRLKNTNVYFDLSAPQLYSMKVLKKAVEQFGFYRLLLGSDTPYGIDNLERVRNRLVQLPISEEGMACICGNNLSRLLSLEK